MAIARTLRARGLAVDCVRAAEVRTPGDRALRARHGDKRADLAHSLPRSAASPGRAVALAAGMAFTKVLCPTDFSAGSQLAMRTAVQIANAHAAELVLVHSW